MVCLWFEPGTGEWKAHTNPLSYLWRPHDTEMFSNKTKAWCDWFELRTNTVRSVPYTYHLYLYLPRAPIPTTCNYTYFMYLYPPLVPVPTTHTYTYRSHLYLLLATMPTSCTYHSNLYLLPTTIPTSCTYTYHSYLYLLYRDVWKYLWLKWVFLKSWRIRKYCSILWFRNFQEATWTTAESSVILKRSCWLLLCCWWPLVSFITFVTKEKKQKQKRESFVLVWTTTVSMGEWCMEIERERVYLHLVWHPM